MIEIKHVTKTIHGQTVLSDISLGLEYGTAMGLSGANGSGKTMLMRIACGLVQPSTGAVVIDGEPLNPAHPFPQSVGILIEEPAFLPGCTGYDNLKLLADIKGVTTDDDIRCAIERVGLNPHDRKRYRAYSLGMKQRLGIAAAIMEKPTFILLDEPTNALDEDGEELLRGIVLEEKARGAAILVSSHDSEVLKAVADQIIRLKAGSIVKQG